VIHRLSSIRPPGLWAEEGQLDRRKSTGVCVERNPTRACLVRLSSCVEGIELLRTVRDREYRGFNMTRDDKSFMVEEDGMAILFAPVTARKQILSLSS
jgi:hypothetical protein